ncbi:MAG: hypothetical protein RLZZ573_1670 [Pseudomonadota bacterium]
MPVSKHATVFGRNKIAHKQARSMRPPKHQRARPGLLARHAQRYVPRRSQVLVQHTSLCGRAHNLYRPLDGVSGNRGSAGQ